MKKQDNIIKILTPDLTIFLNDPAETTMSYKTDVHFGVQFHFPASWKCFLQLFSPKFVYFVIIS